MFKIKLFIERTWKEKLQTDNTSVKAMHGGKKKNFACEDLGGRNLYVNTFG